MPSSDSGTTADRHKGPSLAAVIAVEQKNTDALIILEWRVIQRNPTSRRQDNFGSTIVECSPPIAARLSDEYR